MKKISYEFKMDVGYLVTLGKEVYDIVNTEAEAKEVIKEYEKDVEYNTWLAKVNISNLESNYEAIRYEGERLLMLDDYDFKIFVKSLLYHDTIDWTLVDMEKIKETISDSI